MTYSFTPSALKDLGKLGKMVAKQILSKLDFYITIKDPLKFAKPIKDARFGEFRFRIGDYRVIFDVNKKRGIIILAIGHRKDIYR